ncbi:hypothetical protein NDU88_000169 [Pleurodeles waltl]|uniref:Protein phosphatase 1 regulatory subunit 1A n=1 Tax=Pleurodeles waltl TaxID=8319 RepID=A0AAV7S7W7_PLEWA|nr:hypothetical protein NDU88_000169 [Pleurodeles waltl]
MIVPVINCSDSRFSLLIRRRRPTPATLVLTSDQSSPEIDEDRILNPFLKSSLVMSPRQRKKMTRTTPTMKGTGQKIAH